METIKRKFKFINFIYKLIGFDFGTFNLSAGRHEIFVPTNIHPHKVWVKLHGSGVDGCCQMPINEIGYTIKCKGIVFNVSVQTEECQVEWFAVI